MSRFCSQYNFNHTDPRHFEMPEGDSMTEQDQSLSVKEILERFTSGTLNPEEVTFTSDYYNEDIDNPDPHFLDITEVEEIGRTKDEILEQIRASTESEKAQ